METTLEVRWFVKGTPSTAIQHWFEHECLGELLNDEPDREDLYAYGNQVGDYDVRDEAVNLKLRQGNPELKLRNARLGTYQFENAQGDLVWTGKIERWTKFSQAQLNKSVLTGVRDKIEWLRVNKVRSQKIYRDVKSELTYLRVQGDRWWSLAFEMPQDDKDLNEQHLLQVVQQTAQTYPGFKLTADCSYSYSRWQTHFII